MHPPDALGLRISRRDLHYSLVRGLHDLLTEARTKKTVLIESNVQKLIQSQFNYQGGQAPPYKPVGALKFWKKYIFGLWLEYTLYENNMWRTLPESIQISLSSSHKIMMKLVSNWKWLRVAGYNLNDANQWWQILHDILGWFPFYYFYKTANRNATYVLHPRMNERNKTKKEKREDWKCCKNSSAVKFDVFTANFLTLGVWV